MQLETYEATAPLTGTVTEQRQQRREAFRRFLACAAAQDDSSRD